MNMVTSFQTLKRPYNSFIMSHQTGHNFACPWDSEVSSRRNVNDTGRVVWAKFKGSARDDEMLWEQQQWEGTTGLDGQVEMAVLLESSESWRLAGRVTRRGLWG